MKQESIEVKKESTFDIGELWYNRYESIIECENIYGKEHFYPLYKWKNYYSYSLLKLLIFKGELNFNSKINDYITNGVVKSYLPPDILIDKDIERVGDELICKKIKIKTQKHFIQEFSSALIKDIRFLENLHPDAVFGILTGGKDSLNILLLPWKNRIVAFSGSPNYSLVKEFCQKNNLKIDVIELKGEDSETEEFINKEVLINACRIGLQDVRWTKYLKDFQNDEILDTANELVIITGSLGDTFLTPYFKKYITIWRGDLLKYLILNFFKNRRAIFFQNMWNRGAQWQGVYHGILRESSNLSNYSAYHGENVLNVLSVTDLEKVIKLDLRPLIGDYILGKEVIYPFENPSPHSWSKRVKYSTIEIFQNLFDKYVKIN